MPPPSTPAPDLWLLTPAYDASTGTWTDAGTLGFSPGQASAPARPVLLTDSGFKGLPGVQFDATQYLSGTSMPLANSRARGTLMVAFRSDYGSPPGGAVFSTTQDQLAVMSDGRIALNTAAAEYGTMSPGAKAGMVAPPSGQLVTLVYDGTQGSNATRLRFWRNLIEEVLTYTGTISATTYAGGTTLYIGREAAGAGWAQTTLEVLFWRDVALSTTDRVAWENYLAAKYFTKTTKALVVSGDSNGQGAPVNTLNPWPLRAQVRLGWSHLDNGSATGFKLVDLVPLPKFDVRDDWYARQPYLVALGTNDLAVDHASLATLQGLFNSLVTKLTAARFPIYALTIPAAGANISGADETTRLAYNAWLAGLPGVTVIDVAAALGVPPNVNFEGDDLHFSSTGHDVVALLVADALTPAPPRFINALSSGTARFLLYDPREVREARQRFRRDSIPVLDQANSLCVPAGRNSTRGYVLLARSDYDKLDTYSTDLCLHIGDTRNANNVAPLRNLTIVQAQCVTRGIAADPNALYLVELTDARGILHNRWFQFPLTAQYNIRAPAYPQTFHPASMNGGTTWTWATMLRDMWLRMPLLGAWPGLPVVPQGTPEGFWFVGVSAWTALCDVLDHLGLTVACDLTQAAPYTIVRPGAADAAFTLLQARYATNLEDDLEWIDVGAGRVPGTVVVLFKRRNSVYGTEETVYYGNDGIAQQWDMRTSYAVSVAAPVVFALAVGTHYLWSDFTVRYDDSSNPIPADVTEATAIAQERVTQYFARIYWQTLGCMDQVYAGALPFANGAQVDGVRWAMDHRRPLQYDGWTTQITRGRPLHSCNHSYE